MSDDERIVLRLSPDTVAVYRALVSRGEFRSINDAVRSVLDGYASERLAQGVAAGAVSPVADAAIHE